MDATLVDRLDAALPQTQCTRCGYDGCRPYAEAIARRDAEINRCPPGGTATITLLAALTGASPRPLDPCCGAHAPLLRACIDEARCIGCALCIEACPVDAILGAAKRMHVVMASLCSGCELCVAPCPVDCITMRPAGRAWTRVDGDAARARHEARAIRRARGEPLAQRLRAPSVDTIAARQATVGAATARARARRQRPAADAS